MKHQEPILVIPVDKISERFKADALVPVTFMELTEFATSYEFHPRYLMETDEEYKQVIPYIVAHDGNGKVLTYVRSSSSGEDRLHHKLSIGVGGHIDEDMSRNNESGIGEILKGAIREVQEELHIETKSSDYKVIGVLNEDSSAVGRVHIGVVLLLKVDPTKVISSGEVNVLINRRFLTLQELEGEASNLEMWSQFTASWLKGVL